jgi:hypothetical protein
MMGDDLYYVPDEYRGSVVLRSVLAGFAFFVAIASGTWWLWTVNAYQMCSSPIGGIDSRCGMITSTHSASAWVALLAMVGGIASCIWASRA